MPIWEKFSKAVDLLEMPLKKIVDYYKNGLLDEFTPTELKHFILGLFSDSALRRQSVELLESS